MDLLTQIQVGVAKLPRQLQESMATLVDTPLSVQEAHALSQLSQTGFVGFQNITNPMTPVGLNDELVPFLNKAGDAIGLAREFYAQVRTIDVLISKIPDTRGPGVGSANGTGGSAAELDFEAQLLEAIAEHDRSVEELYIAECESKEIRAAIRTVLDFGVNLSTQPLGIVEGVVHPPRMGELFTPVVVGGQELQRQQQQQQQQQQQETNKNNTNCSSINNMDEMDNNK